MHVPLPAIRYIDPESFSLFEWELSQKAFQEYKTFLSETFDKDVFIKVAVHSEVLDSIQELESERVEWIHAQSRI